MEPAALGAILTARKYIMSISPRCAFLALALLLASLYGFTRRARGALESPRHKKRCFDCEAEMPGMGDAVKCFDCRAPSARTAGPPLYAY